MRKIKTLGHGMLVVALAAAVAAPLTLTACGGESEAEPEAVAEEQAQEAEPAEQAPASDYAVTIDGATVTTDYDGNPAVIVDYTFTNNSDEATSFSAACYAKVFQNGVQLEPAIVTSEDLGNGSIAEIKPGATTQVRSAYTLTDQSDISVEVEELFSLDDTMLAEATFSVA